MSHNSSSKEALFKQYKDAKEIGKDILEKYIYGKRKTEICRKSSRHKSRL